MIKGYHDAKIISIPKHFPGYVNCKKDPHGQSCSININDLGESIEIFDSVIQEANIKGLMFAHIIIPEIDSVPITRSSKFIDWFKKELDFNGLYITDSVGMGSFLMGKPEKAVSFIIDSFKAGYDMIILPSNQSFSLKIIKELYDNLKDIEFKKVIDRSYKKIINFL